MARWQRHSADFEAFESITALDTVVDVGCGPGDACVAAGQLGAEVIAIDIDPLMIGYVTEKMRGVPTRAFRAIQSDCDPIPLPDATADVILCTEVLEHVDDPARFLGELNRIGKPGATYILSVPDPTSESLMRAVAHPSYFETPNHQHVYGREQFDSLVRSSGLEILDRPNTPNNAFWAMWCLLRWADTPNGLPREGESSRITEDWQRVWSSLESSPRGAWAIAELDRILPRSQAVIARKAGSKAHDRSEARRASARRLARWKRHFKHGSLQLGRFSVSWSIRRV